MKHAFLQVPLIGFLACGALPAQAADLDAAPTQQLKVHGDIAQHCAISSPGNVDFGNLEQSGLSADLKFGLNCNMPFVMRVEAQRGALTNLDYPAGQGDYSGRVPYALDFTIPARSPTPTVIRASFAGRELTSGQSISSGGAIATDGMGVRVTLGRPDRDAGLMAGNYGETITISLSSI